MNIFDAHISGSLSVSSSAEISGDLKVLGVVTGSFKGDGSQIQNIPASGVTGLNLTQIADGEVTASISQTNGLRVNTNSEITGALKVTGSIYLNGNPIGTGKLDESTFNSYTSSNDDRVDAIETTTGSFATTGSNYFKGNQTISGSLLPSGSLLFDIGSETNRWRDIFLAGSTINLGGTKITKDNDGNIQLKDSSNNLKNIVASEFQIGEGANAIVIKRDNSGYFRLAGQTQPFIAAQLSGSFTGSGAGLYDIPASGVTGLNLTQIADGSATASISNTNGLRVNTDTEITGALTISGSISLNGVPVGTGKLDESTFNTYTTSINLFSSSIDTTIKDKLNTESVISGSVQVSITGTTGYSTFSSSISNDINSLSSSVTSTINSLSSSISGSVGNISASIATTTLGLGTTITNVSSSISTSISDLSGSVTTINDTQNSRLTSVEGSTGSLNSFTSSINTTIKDKMNADGVLSGSITFDISTVPGFSGLTESVSGSISSSVNQLSGSLTLTVTNLSSSLTNTDESQNARITTIESRYATTGSNSFVGTQNITGSLIISQNLTVLGSSSIVYATSSQMIVEDNVIILNASTPAERFAGIQVYDSGSNGEVTASLFWDGQNNRWIYQNSSEAHYGGAMFIAGPRNTGSLGDEITLTNGRIPKSIGGDHIGDSIITEFSGSIAISGSLIVTGSVLSLGTSLVSGSSQISFNGITDKPSLVSGSSQIDHNATTNYDSNKHIDHTAVSITAGSGLTGGGDISSTRTINVGAGNGITVNADDIAIDTSSATFTNGVKSKLNTEVVHSGSYLGTATTANLSENSSYLYYTDARVKTKLNAEGVLSGSAQVTGLSNSQLTNSSVTVTAGTGMSGGGSVSLGGTITLTNAGVTSITGTSNQVNASTSTGGVTLSLPQSIATGSTPTFAGLTINGSSVIANTTSINPSGYTNTVVAGGVGTGGWGITSGVGGNAGTNMNWALGHNGSKFYFGLSNGSAALATWMEVATNKTITLNGYTTNGFVKFSNSDGTLAVDTNSYQTVGSTFYVGTTSIANNRSSASQTLTGVSIDGNAATVTGGVYTSGDQTISGTKTFSGTASFGSSTRQMINLWGTQYGIGVQSSTLYYRSDSRFSWHRGGSHSDTENTAGSGGTVAMTLDGSSNLTVTGTITASGGSSSNWNTAYGWGNHASAGYQTTSGTVAYASYLNALNNYVWAAATTPTSFHQGLTTSFVQGSDGFQSYGSVMTMRTYSGGGGSLQMYVPYSPTYGGPNLQVRFGNYDVSSGNSWTSWKVIANKYSTSFSSVTSVTVTHNLGTKDVAVFVYDGSDNMFWPSSIVTTSTSVVTITFASSRSGRVVVIG